LNNACAVEISPKLLSFRKHGDVEIELLSFDHKAYISVFDNNVTMACLSRFAHSSVDE